MRILGADGECGPDGRVHPRRPGLFESADANASVPQHPEERREFGTTWTLAIGQGGVVMSVEVYV